MSKFMYNKHTHNQTISRIQQTNNRMSKYSVMLSSVITESSSDAEELTQVDSDEEELPDDSFSQETAEKTLSESFDSYVPEDSDNNSLYNRCWQRAEHYVHDFIKEQDDKLNEDQTSSGRGIIDDQEEFEEKFADDYQQIDFNERSDTEFSQLSQSSSDESKTYSQVYSEILEESKARQKKAEKYRKVYNHNSNRTKSWVENIGKSDIDDCTTDASDRESEENFPPSDRELDYETLVKEQLEVIAQYQDDPLGSFRSCIEEYMSELQGLQENQEKKKDNAKENPATNRSNQSNVNSIRSYSQNLDFESKSSPVEDKDATTEILRFEHCDIYHVKRSDKSTIKDADNRTLTREEIVSTRSKNLETKDCENSLNGADLEENRDSDDSELYEEISSKKSEKRQPEETNLSADNSYEVEEPYSEEEWKSEETLSDHNESIEDKSSEALTRQDSVTESEESYSDHNELQKPLRTRRTLNKSERASNNSHKSLYLPTTSSCSRKTRNSHGETSDSSDNYYLSSKSLTSTISQVSRKSRSVTKTPRTYEDRGCSPIKIKSCSRKKGTVGHKSESDYEVTESDSSSRTYRQYPETSTDSERESSIKSVKSPSSLRVYNFVKGGEDELLDLSLSDDETQIQATPLSDRKKNPSSGNSSYNSLTSSIWSISSYEPSVRFHRRTESEDDDVSNPVDDSGPMTYKKHVARLAERALRNCTNYYNEGIKLNPQLDEELNKHVQMLYESEMSFNSLERPEQQERQLQGCSDG